MLPTGTSNQPQFACTDENRHFSTDHLNDDLGGRPARGGAVTVGAQVFKFLRGERYARWEPIRQPANVQASAMATTTLQGRG